MQFHVWQDYFVEDDGWKTAIQKLTQAGKVKFWGISINEYQPSNCLKTLETGLISSVQFIFNLWHQKPVSTLLPYAAKHKIGLIARVPLDEGGLSGKIDETTKFVDGDFRNMYFGGDRKTELVSRLEKLNPLLGKEAQSVLELSFRWILSHPEISTVIPGMRKVLHVESNLSFSDGQKLSRQLMEELAKHSWERNFYSDPLDPAGGGWIDPALKSTSFIEP
jgi:aryl-alcohol dehydrogenase-like predicted oxidoreductase